MKEKTKKLNSLEEKLTSIQRKHEKEVSNLQNQHEARVKALENQLEERVNIQIGEINKRLNQNNNKIKKEINTDRWTLFLCFAVVFVIAGVLLGLANRVNVVQKSFEEQVNNVQSKLELAVDDFQKKTDSLLNTGLGSDNTFTWKIKNFENVLTLAKSGSKIEIESKPFYMYGYKLKLLLYPNGNIDGQNTHLSLYVTVMKGEYDAILAWPLLQKKFTLTLIDQQENPAERKNVIFEFTADPTHVESFAKPITNENAGRGYQKFVSHEQLRTRRFLVDDIIFIQIQVRLSSWL